MRGTGLGRQAAAARPRRRPSRRRDPGEPRDRSRRRLRPGPLRSTGRTGSRTASPSATIGPTDTAPSLTLLLPARSCADSWTRSHSSDPATASTATRHRRHRDGAARGDPGRQRGACRLHRARQDLPALAGAATGRRRRRPPAQRLEDVICITVPGPDDKQSILGSVNPGSRHRTSRGTPPSSSASATSGGSTTWSSPRSSRTPGRPGPPRSCAQQAAAPAPGAEAPGRRRHTPTG